MRLYPKTSGCCPKPAPWSAVSRAADGSYKGREGGSRALSGCRWTSALSIPQAERIECETRLESLHELSDLGAA